MFDYKAEDADEINLYNGRRSLQSATRLQVDMGPAPFDGDPFKAKIVLLLNNPMFNTDSKPEDHRLQFQGWPLAGLHPSVRAGFRDWYSRPFGYLIKEHGSQPVAQNSAIVQIVPWASKSFDLNCRLPSRKIQVEIAKQAVKRGAVVIIGRSLRFWLSEIGNSNSIFIAKNRRNPTISPAGLGIDKTVFDARVSKLF